MTTHDALTSIAVEREAQRGDTDGLLTSRNDLICVALAYLGRAASGVRRNECAGLDPAEMLRKAGAVIVAALEAATLDYAQCCESCSTLLRLEWMQDDGVCPQCGSEDISAVSRGGSEDEQWEGVLTWQDAALDYLARRASATQGDANRFTG